MSHDVQLLASTALPERPGGYRGYVGPAPLWYAAVSLRVEPFDALRHAHLASQVALSAPFAQVLHLNYQYGAADFADRYIGVLRRATGAARFNEGRLVGSGAATATPMAVEQLERALFDADLEELSQLESPPTEWEFELDDVDFEVQFERPRTSLDEVMVVAPDKHTNVESLLANSTNLRCVSLFDWARAEPTWLSRLAKRCSRRNVRLNELTHVIVPISPAGWGADGKLQMKLYDSCLFELE